MGTAASFGLLELRLVIAVIMAFHGTQKLFGWWDGGGLDRAEKFFGAQGFRPPRLMALVAGVTETTGAVLLGTGALSVLGTAMLTGVLTNVTALHLRNGLDGKKHGFEFELMILAGVIAVGFCGPGRWSIDHWLDLPRGAPWGPVAVALGVLAGLTVVASRKPVDKEAMATVPARGR
ncbi:DoxX family protein [Streptomyces sp. NPDC087263]|uniref:DoxX family protein n=1 Tax=Streptomyces sp. NPDC087263 TaxID=3365773 RepID=UPI003820C84E